MLAALGNILIFFTLRDVICATLLPRSGSLSGRLTTWLWRVALWFYWRVASQQLLAVAGVLLLLTTVAVWTLLLWLGWFLVFLAGDPSVTSAQQGAPASPSAVFYFTGYTLITLGNGDFQPAGPLWQLLSVLASMSGFFLFTLSVTFLFSVVQAAVKMRGTAVYISSLGDTPFDVLRRLHDGESCRALVAHLTPLLSQLTAISQQHLAYPVLHYLHSARRYNALPLQVAVLDETLFYLRHGVAERGGLTDPELAPLERAVSAFLLTLKAARLEAADEPPPAEPLAALHEHGLSTLAEGAFREALTACAERRRLLLALVEKDGWSWKDVYRPTDERPTPRDKFRRGEVKRPYT